MSPSHGRQKHRTTAFKWLSAAEDVEIRGDHFFALTETPWLRLEFAPPAGRWIRLTYATSLFDPLARPVIRCIIGGRHHDEILPGPLFGRGVWLGYIPKATEKIMISPTNYHGDFSFSIDSVSSLSIVELVLRSLWREPLRCFKGLLAHLFGLQYTANIEFRRALSATKLSDYRSWRKLRFRDLDLTALDVPRIDWRNGPHVRFVTTSEFMDSPDLRSLLSELNAQPYPHWTLAVIGSSGTEGSTEPPVPIPNARIITVRPDAEVADILDGLSGDDLIAPIILGDKIPRYVVGVLAEAAARRPSTEVFYGDEEFIDSAGRYVSLRLRPDWSPTFGTEAHYFDGAAFLRVRSLRRSAVKLNAGDFLHPSDLVAKISSDRNPEVDHIRRVMRTRRNAQTPISRSRKTTNLVRRRTNAERLLNPHATIIIPTRDRVDLLEQCVSGLRKGASLPDVEVIIIDNGSSEPRSRRFLTQLASEERFRVLSRPGPFNFSKLCNDAAAEASTRTLVFLNNDTETIDDRWLAPLLYWAQQGEIGAVGAKLLYPNGRLQHAGVVLGIDGRAGHFERMLGSDDPGYFGRLCVPHEVSAVTAACLAVEKNKFDAVGGFDAVNLAVELNDIDLCLRLSERGWKSICTPDSVLIHHESSSRGMTFRPDKIYKNEHHYFRTRWMHRLRDDPYFHPALSLDRLDAALG
jgi:GT2 family glycosyltransferase